MGRPFMRFEASFAGRGIRVWPAFGCRENAS